MIPLLDDAIADFTKETGRAPTTLYVGDVQFYCLLDQVARGWYRAVDHPSDRISVHGLRLFRVYATSHFALA